MSHWAKGSLGAVRDELSGHGLGDAEIKDNVNQVIGFSIENHLTVTQVENTTKSFLGEAQSKRKSWWRWLVDNYLFIRIPLVKPQAFLDRTISIVAPLWSRAAIIILVALGGLALFLVGRQWDAFVTSFLYFFSVQGLIAYGLGLVVVKIFHELGHAYTATRFGCRVPSMGISFLVLMPVLYTDTTGAWRLTSRRKRLLIDCAGVSVELMLAVLATLAWALLPDGTLRSVAFIVATTSWTMSLLVNLNPFMRFDGYYALSDALGIPNLQPRAFAFGRWRLRELFFDLNAPVPEALSPRMRRTLIVYAWMTWIYRLILFIGIALLVYHLFFKLLGVILFVVEIAVFIARPVINEFKAWWHLREQIAARPRTRWIAGGVFVALFLTVLPLDRHVSAPAVLSSATSSPIVAGKPAYVSSVLVKDGDQVKTGDALIQLADPLVIRDRELALARIASLETRLARGASDAVDLSQRRVLERRLIEERQSLAALSSDQARLTLRAVADGRVVDIGSDLAYGRWINGSEVLARVISPTDRVVLAYIPETDRDRLQADAAGRFVPDDASLFSSRVRLIDLSDFALETIDQPQLASIHGGSIPVDDDDERLVPRNAFYRAELVAERSDGTNDTFAQKQSGQVVISAEGQSLFGSIFAEFAQLLRSEATLSE
ncbi:MAG: site-2 protease family protein [Pseudomonadota bacterium]